MTGPLIVVPGRDHPELVDESIRLTEQLAADDGVKDESRPSVVAVCFDGVADVDAVRERRPDELVVLERETGVFERGAMSISSRVDALESVVRDESPRAVIVASTADGDDLAARFAGRVNGASVTDCLLRVRDGELVAGRSVYGDRGFGTISFEDGVPAVSLNIDALGEPRTRSEGVEKRRVTVSFEESSRIRQVERITVPERDLSRAKRIVAGGQGLGGEDGFDVVESLAETLNASVGASRPPADEGWVAYDRQIGVTGKEIDTALYVPCAISGDPYHMRAVEAEHLVAVNSDPEARIFDDADLGVVGDVFEYGPVLADAVRDAREAETAPENEEATR